MRLYSSISHYLCLYLLFTRPLLHSLVNNFSCPIPLLQQSSGEKKPWPVLHQYGLPMELSHQVSTKCLQQQSPGRRQGYGLGSGHVNSLLVADFDKVVNMDRTAALGFCWRMVERLAVTVPESWKGWCSKCCVGWIYFALFSSFSCLLPEHSAGVGTRLAWH